MRTGVIVARFQVPYLHAGHEHLIHSVAQRCNHIVVVLGTPSAPNERNILPFNVRSQMLDEWFGLRTYMYSIAHILDHHEDKEWSAQLDLICGAYSNVTLYGSRDCFHKFYVGKLPFEEIPEKHGYSGTQLRDIAVARNTAEYRIGLMHGFLMSQNKTYKLPNV